MKRFYNFSLYELDTIDLDTFKAYWTAIDTLEAQEELSNFRMVTLPSQKDDIQRERLRELESIAYPRHIYPRKSVSLDDLDKILNGG